jgi:ubiquinone/menaquinone biosynthesis C-methylase UbiE
MNRFENWYCGSSLWRYLTRRELLPWLLQGSSLGESVLELGAGPGAATEELAKQTRHLTSLELSHRFASNLAKRVATKNISVVQGDAAVLPFANRSFSAAIAILMLHHLKSRELQDNVFRETFRILKPGGVFLAFEVEDAWIHRIGHLRSTFTPVSPGSALASLTSAGFERVAIDFRKGRFRIRAIRASEDSSSEQEIALNRF